MWLLHLSSDQTHPHAIVNILKETHASVLEYKQVTSMHEIMNAIAQQQPIRAILLNIHSSKIKQQIQSLSSFIKRIQNPIPIFVISSFEFGAALIQYRMAGVRDCFSAGSDLSMVIQTILKTLEEYSLDEPYTTAQANVAYAGHTLTRIAATVSKIITHELNCVLVTGESGTGKELVAQIFKSQLPKAIEFLNINCATISEDLVYSELFGHKKGSFTGALSDKTGIIQAADRGWIFLDEIARLNHSAQGALLRTIENGEVRPVGTHLSSKVSMRILSATNENFETLIAQGAFREDLLQRLRQYEIKIPPLRERSSIEKNAILEFLIKKLNTQTKQSYYLSPEVRQICLSHPWAKGNLRELFNFLNTCAINATGSCITLGAIQHDFCKEFLTSSPHPQESEHSTL